MTPKEKAEDLVKSFLEKVGGVPKKLILILHKGDSHVETAKQCAIICVDEILWIYNRDPKHPQTKYWSNVKSELQKL